MSGWTREFVSLESPTAGRNGAGFLPCQGLYYRPQGQPPKTAMIATHYNVDFSEHYLESPATARDDTADLIVAWLRGHGV